MIIYNGALIVDNIKDNIKHVLHKRNITITGLPDNIISIEYTNENFEIIRVQCDNDNDANTFVHNYYEALASHSRKHPSQPESM